MAEETSKKEENTTRMERTGATPSTTAEAHSKPLIAVGTAGAAVGALLAAAWLGVFPAALAGAAGYFAYRGLKRKPAAPVEGR